MNEQGVSVDVYYVDSCAACWRIPPRLLYAGSPADFELRLDLVGEPFASAAAMAADMKEKTALVLPVADDGGALLAMLESEGVPFVGSSSAAHSVVADKAAASTALAGARFPVLDQLVFDASHFVDLKAGAALSVRPLAPSRACALCINDGC